MLHSKKEKKTPIAPTCKSAMILYITTSVFQRRLRAHDTPALNDMFYHALVEADTNPLNVVIEEL